jgi:hypothetical protein
VDVLSGGGVINVNDRETAFKTAAEFPKVPVQFTGFLVAERVQPVFRAPASEPEA